MGKLAETIKVKEVYRGLIVSIIIGFILGIILKNFDMNDFYGTFAGVSASLFGFLVTALSIILVFPKKGRMKVLEKHRLYPTLFYGFILAIFSQILLFIFSLFGIFFSKIWEYQTTLFIIVLSVSILFLLLCIWILKMMLDVLFDKHDAKKANIS